MRTSIWYRDEEKRPDKSGHYLSFRGFGMGGTDDSSPYGYLYYNKKKDVWQEYVDGTDVYLVYYWTDATPDDWTERDPPRIVLKKMKPTSNPTLDSAWKDVQTAIDKYNMIKELVK